MIFLKSKVNKKKYIYYLGVCATISLIVVQLFAPENSVHAQNLASEWIPPINFSQQPNTFSDQPVMMCDKYQNVHVFWVEREENRHVIYYKTDKQGVWSYPSDVSLSDAILYLNGMITPDDTVHLVWLNRYRGEFFYSHAPLYYADKAKFWSPPTTLTSSSEGGALSFNKTGTLFSIYIVTDEDAIVHNFYLVRSEDHGETWSDPIRIFTYNTPVQSVLLAGLTIDGKNRLHLVWGSRSFNYGEFSELGYMRSDDEGINWVASRILATSYSLPGVAAIGAYNFDDDPDKIFLTYDVPDRLFQSSSDGGETWSEPVMIMNLGAAFGGWNQIVKDSMGILHVVSAVNPGVYSSTWNGTRWDKPELIDDRYIDPHHQQLVVCQGNQLHLVYDDRTGENEIWYSEKQVDGPRLNRQPIPVPNITETPEVTIPSDVTQVSTQTPGNLGDLNSQPITNSPSPSSAIYIAIGPVILLIIVTVIVKFKLTRK